MTCIGGRYIRQYSARSEDR